MQEEAESSLPLKVKNTFYDLEGDEEHDMRNTKSVPYSFKAFCGDKEENFVVRFAEVIEEEEFEEESPVTEVEPSPIAAEACVKNSSHVTPRTASTGVDPRVRAVTFMLPSEATRLTVKNTFVNIEEDSASNPGSPTMRPQKSVPVSFKPGSEDVGLPLSPTSSSQLTSFGMTSEFVTKTRTSTGEDEEEEPLCHLRTVSIGPDPRGPHLGLLWAPEGHSWHHHPLLSAPSAASVPPLAPAPVPVAVAAAPAVPAPAAPVDAPVDPESVWGKSQSPQGCRQVQQMLDDAPTDQARLAIALDLRGHIWEALRSPHANYVVAKCIATLPVSALQFILDEIPAEVAPQASKHKFGCRIIQRLIEKCPSEMVNDLVEAILVDFNMVARHPYGNYVAQNLLQNGTEGQKQRMISMIETDIRGLTSDSFGCTVVNASLSAKGSQEGPVRIARAILKEPGLLLFAACTRHGHVAASRVLKVLQGQELANAKQMLQEEAESLRASRFGRNVVEML